ncbi:hypothetical protein BDN70DRAFT_998425 [Pholiota conissans]|uniref:Uncharacterized protein n=1 Tax=Pholiota conissans TaxID=109636 RepID=A0A9P5YNN5_9AGAR|nr:hypothetical protein BDN70DRAFT_998425 [Pholiota conissans]
MAPLSFFGFGALLICGTCYLTISLASPVPNLQHIDVQSLKLSPLEVSLHGRRSVWNIVWSCVSTIVACCWVAVHPNMLRADATRWKLYFHRLAHMVLMIIAPELIICWAMRQWVGARNLMRKEPFKQHNINHRGEDDRWTMGHGYFLQMGGFIVEEPLSPPQILTAKRLEELVDENRVTLPIIPARELYDRSKNDDLSKTIAIGQTTWFLAQCLTRKLQGLITTKIEIVTVAFAALNVFVYYFWWEKPMDVQSPVRVPVSLRMPEPKIFDDLPSPLENPFPPNPAVPESEPDKACARICLFMKNLIQKTVIKPFAIPLKIVTGLFRRAHAMLLTNDSIQAGSTIVPTFYALNTNTEREKFIILVTGALLGVLFGGIHCVDWDYVFPTHEEMVIWRASAVIITAVAAMGVIVSSTLYLGQRNRRDEVVNSLWGESLLWVGAIGLIPYAVARVLLLVEAFVSLRDLPQDALLDVRWTSFIPHFQ